MPIKFRYDHYNTQSRGFETSRDLAVRRPSAEWIEAQHRWVFNSPDSNVGWPNVVPTSVLSSRRWANVAPTYTAVWVGFSRYAAIGVLFRSVCGLANSRISSLTINPNCPKRYSIAQEICTRFCCALLCCGYAIVHNEFTWSIYPYSSGLLCWHRGNR